MKKNTVSALLFLLLAGLLMPGCKDLYCDTGTLAYTNDSYCTTHRLSIDGVSYGLVYPGETREIDLEKGRYLIQVFGDGICGYGCTPGSVSVSACKTTVLGCSN